MTADPFQKNQSTLPGTHAQVHEQARMRLALLAMFLVLGYLAVSFRLIDLTMFRGSSAAGAVAGKEDIKPLGKPLRGSVVDRNGTLMAASLKMASVYADTTMVEKPDELAKRLAAIIPEQGYKDLLRKLSSGKRFIWLQRNITPKQEYAINALGDPALGFQEEERRIYPDASLTAHIIGYTDLDGKGIAGIEKTFDSQLAEGERPVQLTVDLRVQHILHRELGKAVTKFHAKAGIGMVMDVDTGEVIAMVSLPDFDPNHAGDAADQQKFNRATLGVFEMGSTFKLFSTAAALDSGLVRFSDTFDATDPIKIGRFTISDFHAKRRALTVPEIFIYSSNIGTAKMAATLGNEKMQNFYRTMGFMEQAKLELPERGTPLYPSPWRDISTLTTSFGHGIAISPLHLIRAASALVNGGTMPQATLVRADQYPAGPQVISPETSHRLRQLLELTVVNGTGNNAYVEGYNVGGKTGTAEKNIHGSYEHNALLSSFLGVFPIGAPRYAVLAILDEPQGTKDTSGFATGGWTAAPVVARVVEQLGPLYQIPPDLERTRKNIDGEMGMYLKELKEGSSLASLGTDH
jgi:cell division protein FtsI (penicillin-binding protein 3)